MKRKVICGLVASGTVVVLGGLWCVWGAFWTKQSTGRSDVLELSQEQGVATVESNTKIRELLAGNRDLLVDKLLAVLDTEEEQDEYTEQLSAAVQSLPDSKLKSTLETLAGRGSAGVNLLRDMLVRRWAEVNPRNAAEWVSQLRGGDEYRSAVSQVAIAWAGSDPQAAWGWVASLPETAPKQEASLEIGYEVAVSQPAIGIGIASTLPAGDDRDNLVVHIIRQWAASEPDLATGWVAAVADTALRERLLTAVTESLAERDPVTASAWVANNLTTGAELDRSLIEIVQRWAETSPTGAAAWIAAYPETPLRQTAMQNLIMVWSAQDVASAARWVEGLPPGPLRETGLIALAEGKSGAPR